MKKNFPKNKISAALFALLFCASAMAGCTSSPAASSESTQNSAQTVSAAALSAEYKSEDEDASWSESDEKITLNAASIEYSGKNATVDGGKITITAAGTYVISGTLTDGQIIVSAGENDAVHLVLNGADITCLNSAPIYVKSADKVILTLAEGTSNTVTDGPEYVYADAAEEEPNAAIFSKSDLTLNGTGSLTVNANFNNGITGKDDLILLSGKITVNAVGDGIRGRDSLVVKNADITVIAGEDGMKSNNDEDTGKGWILIEGGTLSVTSGEDGIQAETSLLISGGTLDITSGGGSANGVTHTMTNNRMPQTTTAETDETASTKGLKAADSIAITGGTITVDSADDSIHTNNTVSVSGGTLTLTSGDDGIHSDTSMEISGGSIDITKSYEGIESASMTILGGEIRVIASDDGINVAGGNDGSSINGRPGANSFSADSGNFLSIQGGTIYVDASGDGIDVNGSLEITGGSTLVYGPTDSGNGALDYDGTFEMNGGFFAAAGSSGMAQTVTASSAQNTIMVTFDSVQNAGTLMNIQSADGAEILTLAPEKSYQTVVVSSPDIQTGSTYKISFGGTSTGTATNGLYSGGTYSGGTEFADVTVSSPSTTAGTAGGMMGGGMGGKGGMGGQKPSGMGGNRQPQPPAQTSQEVS